MRVTSEQRLSCPDGLLVAPERSCGTGVLVLAGSSGRVDTERVRLLGQYGATAMSIQWFGGPGQQPQPLDIPLETFTTALDRLARHCERLAVIGLSFGAEAALLLAARDPRVAAVVAFAPSPVVWAGVAPAADGVPARVTSHWTVDGVPLPFVPFDDTWQPAATPPAFRGLYEQSLQRNPHVTAAAAIPVEQIRGEVVVVGGEDDQVWPSADFARTIAARRAEHGLPTGVITHPEAGHRTILPGEPPVAGGADIARGGTLRADAELGALVWPVLVEVLRLRTAGRGGVAGQRAGARRRPRRSPPPR